jgi:hypothetical protein
MNTKLDWLIGTWEAWDRDSQVIYEIRKTGLGLKVRAFDKTDGEELWVSKTKWDGRQLSFEVRVPSNNYRTRNSLKPISKNSFVQEITFWERWKKIGDIA